MFSDHMYEYGRDCQGSPTATSALLPGHKDNY